MFIREKAINELVNNDFDDIMSGSIPEYLYSILQSGHKGYADYTDEELMQELTDRDISYLFEEEA